VKINDPEIWKKIKNNELVGISIKGIGQREKINE